MASARSVRGRGLRQLSFIETEAINRRRGANACGIKKDAMKKSEKSKEMTSKDFVVSTDLEQSDSPDLVTMMFQIMERFDALEKKMDVMISQNSGRSSEMRQNAERERPSHSHGHPREYRRQGSNQNRDFRQSQGQDHARHEKMLFQTVCAECQKECEVPFKPTGGRPVYCKQCFTARNGGEHSPKTNNEYGRSSSRDRFSKRKNFKFSKKSKR